MHRPPPAEQSAFESRALYNLQATDEDIEEEQDELEKKPPPIPKRPNYRPKPLQWPFIVSMIVVLMMLMGLVVYARETMPNSDSTATIEPRHVVRPRQQQSSAEQQSSVAEPSSSATAEPTPLKTQVDFVSSGNADLPATSEQKQSSTSSPNPVFDIHKHVDIYLNSDEQRFHGHLQHRLHIIRIFYIHDPHPNNVLWQDAHRVRHPKRNHPDNDEDRAGNQLHDHHDDSGGNVSRRGNPRNHHRDNYRVFGGNSG
ncbi:hypothetical protein LZ30DRAFT_827788 [Colletotrichum cereale]|nr:hypothetical protein LZ30DRAFT_827788 [Colletotrichum cereale]